MDVIALGQELVRPEDEYRTSGPRVQQFRPGAQRRLDRFGGLVWGLPGEFGQSAGGLRDGARAGWAYQAPVIFPADDPELRLDPGGREGSVDRSDTSSCNDLNQCKA
ncbi:MAG: hypothetical protein LC776_01665 [Acidobacteria bacterium]|nr:hypothetical protein [Acidobacteriota bacterium]